MPVPIDMMGVSCSKNLRWCTPLGASCLEIVGWDGIRLCAPMFFIWCLILEGSLRRSASCYHHVAWFIGPWWVQLADNATQAGIWWLALVVQVFVCDVELACWFLTWSSSSGSRSDSTWEVHSLTLEGENPMSDLNWLFLAMTLLKALFSASENLLEDGNLISTIGHCRRLYTVSFLEASLLEKL
jgi:hypothetical protein